MREHKREYLPPSLWHEIKKMIYCSACQFAWIDVPVREKVIYYLSFLCHAFISAWYGCFQLEEVPVYMFFNQFLYIKMYNNSLQQIHCTT